MYVLIEIAIGSFFTKRLFFKENKTRIDNLALPFPAVDR